MEKNNNNKNMYEESESDTDNDNDNYKIQTKMCKRLSREFGIEINDEFIIYKPVPEKYGLENSDVIIPSYYNLHKYPSKILDFDFYEIIKDDIRNYRKLNIYQLEYIKNLKEEYKDELIGLFNECIGKVMEILNHCV